MTPDQAADHIEAALLLVNSVWEPDDAAARRLRVKAARAGAVLADLAAAVAERERRIARDVTVIEVDGQ